MTTTRRLLALALAVALLAVGCSSAPTQNPAARLVAPTLITAASPLESLPPGGVGLKDGVSLVGLQPPVVVALMAAREIYADEGAALIITSAVDSLHSATSLHYSGAAVDLRTRHLAPGAAVRIGERLGAALGRDFDVVLESDHLHLEHQPRRAPQGIASSMIGQVAKMSNSPPSAFSTRNEAPAPRRPGWRDFDGDRLDTRAELIRDRCITDIRGGGTWVTCLDGYTGDRIETADPSRDIEVDHRLPWSVASTRRPWSRPGLVQFYSDPDNLVLTSRATNRAKSDKMPGEWCPPIAGAAHADALIATTRYWGIPLDDAELEALELWREGCQESVPGIAAVDDGAALQATAAPLVAAANPDAPEMIPLDPSSLRETARYMAGNPNITSPEILAHWAASFERAIQRLAEAGGARWVRILVASDGTGRVVLEDVGQTYQALPWRSVARGGGDLPESLRGGGTAWARVIGMPTRDLRVVEWWVRE